MLILFLYFNKKLNNHVNAGWGPFLGELKISPCHPGISLSLLYPIESLMGLCPSMQGAQEKWYWGLSWASHLALKHVLKTSCSFWFSGFMSQFLANFSLILPGEHQDVSEPLTCHGVIFHWRINVLLEGFLC